VCKLAESCLELMPNH